MSFTQENRVKQQHVTSSSTCDGCDAHCLCSYQHSLDNTYVFPTINGQNIEHYIDYEYERRFTGFHINKLRATREQVDKLGRDAIFLAIKITHQCDHYKNDKGTKNSFSQEQRQGQLRVAKADTCDGCDAQCRFGCKHMASCIFPTIAGQTIVHYIDKELAHRFVGIGSWNVSQQQLPELETRAVFLASRIAKLCDHYKTR